MEHIYEKDRCFVLCFSNTYDFFGIIKKKGISLILSIFFVFPLFMTAFAEPAPGDARTDGALQMRIGLFDSTGAYTYVHESDRGGVTEYTLYLPEGCDRERLPVSFSYKSLTVDGVELESGQETDVFSRDGEIAVHTSDGDYSLTVISSANLPAVFIETDSGALADIHADKSHKAPGTLTVVEDGKTVSDGLTLEYIKGRGNSSWKANEKRSYNIKLGKKTGLLGMKEAKKWALVSNNMDATLMRNALAYSAAKLTRLPYTVDYAFADLYVNGSYRGNYMICEKIEVGKNRVDIPDLDDANKEANPGFDFSAAELQSGDKGKRSWYNVPNTPAEIENGYLLEYEYPEAVKENAGFLTKSGGCLIIHSPEDATEEEVSFIAGEYSEFEDALYAENGVNGKDRHYSEYIDMDSFVDALLIYEYSANHDSALTSFYIVYSDGRFTAGPLWDFDMSMENPDDTMRLAGALAGSYKFEEFVSIWDLLCSHRDFVDIMKTRFAEFGPVLSGELTKLSAELGEKMDASCAADRSRWDYEIGMSMDIGLPGYPAKRIERMNDDFENLAALVENARASLKKTERISPLVFIFGGSAFAAGVIVLIIFLRKKRKSS